MEAIQKAAGVPVYDLFVNGEDVGCLTIFPNDGPIATVKVDGNKITVKGASLRDCLKAASDLFEVDQEMPYEEPIEDEDGSIAHMKMMENRFANHIEDWEY